MKLFLMIILVLLFVVMARMIARFYVERFDFFNAIKSMLESFELNMNFKKDKLQTFVNNSKNNKKQFNEFVTQYENYISNDVIPDLSNIAILNEEESEFCKQMLISLGRNDASGERAQIKSFFLQIEKYLDKANKDKEKKVPLILKIGLLAGLLVAILFI